MSILVSGPGYIGNFVVGALVPHKFNTHSVTGVPTQLGGTPVVSVYINGNTTEITTGVTLTAVYDSRDPLNDVQIDTSSGYAAGDHCAVITTGTIGAANAVGTITAAFSLGASRASNVEFISGDATAAANAEAFFDGDGYAGTNNVIPTVTTVNGLAASACANIWQDAVGAHFTTANSIGKCLFIDNVVPGASGGHMIAGSNAGTITFGALTITGATTFTGAITGTQGSNNIVGVNLAATGLDSITTSAAAGVPSTFREMLIWLYRRFSKKTTLNKNTGALKTFADNGTTLITTQTVTDDGVTQTIGPVT